MGKLHIWGSVIRTFLTGVWLRIVLQEPYAPYYVLVEIQDGTVLYYQKNEGLDLKFEFEKSKSIMYPQWAALVTMWLLQRLDFGGSQFKHCLVYIRPANNIDQ